MKLIFLRVVFASVIICGFGGIAVAQEREKLQNRWKFIVPCVSNRAEVEAKLGDSITQNKDAAFQTYSSKFEKITVIFSTEAKDSKFCDSPIKVGTVIGFFVYVFQDIDLLDLRIDLTKFKKDASRSPREIIYAREEEGVIVTTHISEKDGLEGSELVRSVQISPLKTSPTRP